MANNYLQFSFMVENVTPEGVKYFEKLCDEYEEREDMQPCQYEAEEFPEGLRLWIYAEEYGDPGSLAEILSEYLKKFDPKGRIDFTWAITCSKLRLDEFSGGGAVVLADMIHFMDVGSWISRTASGGGIYGCGS